MKNEIILRSNNMDESHKNNIEGKRLGTKIYELYTCDFKFFYTYYTSLEKVFLN